MSRELGGRASTGTDDGPSGGPAIVDRAIAPPAWKPVALVAVAACVAHALIAARYGWHRDEFYYVASGRHLAWGYVDQPPLVPVIARLAAALPGGVLPLRAVAIVVQGLEIAVGALVCRELGGGRSAQTLAAGCTAGCAVFVGATLFLGTTPVDQLCWAIILWLTLRAVRIDTVRAWVPVGVVAGIGLEAKHTVAMLLVAIAIALVATRRDVVRHRQFVAAAVVAVVLWLPNLWWDWQHHWTSLDMARVLADDQGGAGGALSQLPLLLLILPGPLIVFMWMRGARWLARNRAAAPYRWLLVVSLVVVVGFTLAGGKPYYPAPMLTALFAAGCVATEERGPGRGFTTAKVLIVVSALLALVLGLPALPPAFATATRGLNKEPMETYGWPDFARQVSDAAHRNPDATTVLAGNYGEAGALETFGPARGLSLPVASGHNAYAAWGPPSGQPTVVIAVGEFDPSYLRRAWRTVTLVARIHLPHGLENEETANDAAIYRCTDPRGTWAALWPSLTHLG